MYLTRFLVIRRVNVGCQTQLQLEKQPWISKHRRLGGSNEDTTGKSVKGDEPPISQGLFASVIRKREKKNCLWTFMEEFGTVESRRKKKDGVEWEEDEKEAQAEIRQCGLF